MVPSNLFVCVLGMTVVFISLIFMVFICHITHFVCDKVECFFKDKQSTSETNSN